MNTPTKLGAYAVGLLALFAAASGVGLAVGPVGSPDDQHSGAEHAAGEHAEAVPESPAGLMVSDRGHRLLLDFRHDGVVRSAELTVRVALREDHR